MLNWSTGNFPGPTVMFLFLFILAVHLPGSATEDRCRAQNEILLCNYGCCGEAPNQNCCELSTNILVIVCVVSGLMLVAAVIALAICCYKNYKDKQANRVRQLHRDRNEPVRPVEPRKPPTYTTAPPEYSEEMPESHFRPITASDFVNMNQRFTSNNASIPRHVSMRGHANGVPGMVSVTHASGALPGTTGGHVRRSRRHGHIRVGAAIPEDGGVTPPPPYIEHPTAQIQANRHRRFIRSPETDGNSANSETTQNNQPTDTTSDTQTHQQVARTPVPNHELSDNSDETRVESRAETVTRVLQPSRIPARARATPYPTARAQNTQRGNNLNVRGMNTQAGVSNTHTMENSGRNGLFEELIDV